MKMVKTVQKKNNQQIYLQKKNKKIKTSIFFPSRLSPSDPVHVTFPEMKIKKLEQFFNYWLGVHSEICWLILTCTGSIPNYRQ